jgi:hypothetical protein
MHWTWILLLLAACDSPMAMNATSPDLAPVRTGCAAKLFGDCVECCNDNLWWLELRVYSCQNAACGVQCADSLCTMTGGLAPSGSSCDTCLSLGWQPMGIIAGTFACDTNASCKPVLDCVRSCVP